ncbi:hypothetical protein BD626DRAFT_495120 [Schizophyllum amplum]|uniref:RmlD-like substrate binding domain-containing protein n=1 Tax=Schizophyllum amplum TaxID=97359 RepID=A0A550CFW9_9AGAR|nr:hypothetical protein BD626DRAFT_495120 [Auriculariopsis ampla]
MKIIITGASGVLGSAIRKAFESASGKGYEVTYMSHSQSGNGLVPLDLTDSAKVEELFVSKNPDWVIHCAAERRPDVAAKDPEAARKLNASVPAYLATLSKKLNFTLTYISTDYVFDGKNPPYKPSSPTNPLNLYGITKRDGEDAALGVDGAKVMVLRIPVLYGPIPSGKNSESAINILLDIVKDQSGKTYKMDHYAVRFPTNVLDIGKFLEKISGSLADVPRIVHYSANEVFTKYEMCQIYGKILNLPITHITPDATEPSGDSAASRPKDCHLDTSETEAYLEKHGLGDLGTCRFEEWWTQFLAAGK